MDQRDAFERRRKAVNLLEEAIQELGPITDEAPGVIREPILEFIDRIQDVGEELKQLRFDRLE